MAYWPYFYDRFEIHHPPPHTEPWDHEISIIYCLLVGQCNVRSICPGRYYTLDVCSLLTVSPALIQPRRGQGEWWQLLLLPSPSSTIQHYPAPVCSAKSELLETLATAACSSSVQQPVAAGPRHNSVEMTRISLFADGK